MFEHTLVVSASFVWGYLCLLALRIRRARRFGKFEAGEVWVLHV